MTHLVDEVYRTPYIDTDVVYVYVYKAEDSRILPSSGWTN